MNFWILRSFSSATGSRSAISPAIRRGQSVVSHWRIGDRAERPAHEASQISSGCLPEAQSAPAPVYDESSRRCRPSAVRVARSRAPDAIHFDSGWRNTRQLFEPPKPNEFDIATRTFALARGIAHDVQIAIRDRAR